MKNADANFFSQLKKSLFFLTVLLSACSHIEQPPRSTPWLPENTPPNFHTTGKLSIKNDQQGFQAGFAWDNASWVKMIDITTPLGSTVGRLCQDEMGATAQNAKGQVFQAKTAGELAYRLTGQEIPLDYLDVWAMGRYSFDEPHQILPNGHLIQAGWTIERTADEKNAPRRLILQRQNLKITIVFKHFNANYRTEYSQCPR